MCAYKLCTCMRLMFACVLCICTVVLIKQHNFYPTSNQLTTIRLPACPSKFVTLALFLN